VTEKSPARYEEIASHLRRLLSEASPGDRLPSEAELCEQFDVSRMTARQAMQMLAADGLIERRRGAGTFVREHPVPRDLGSPLSFTGSMRARGMEASSRTLRWDEVSPDRDEQGALGLDPKDGAYVLERLRLADGTPMAIERVVMPAHLAATLEDGFQEGSLHDAFRRAGRQPAEAHADVSARRASKRERELLDLPPGAIIITERRTIYDTEGAPLERTQTHYAASRYSFRAILRDDGGDR
jgi:GntR family transcriptional regulator